MRCLIVLLLISSISFGQNYNTSRLERKQTQFNLPSKSILDVTKILEGNKKVLKEIIIQVVESGILKNRIKQYYDYDNRGNQVCETNANWISNDWIDGHRECNKYDDNNLKTEWHYDEFENNQWTTKQKQLFVYNSENLLVEWLWQMGYYQTNELSNSFKIEYDYDENNQLIKEVVSNWIDSENTPRWGYQSKTERVLSDSLIVEEYYYWWEGTKWEQSSKKVYSYNQNGYLTLIELFFLEADNWNIYNREQIEYDENNNVIDSLIQNMENGNWTNYYQKQYEYEDNLLTKDKYFMWDSDGALGWNGVVSYKYNEKKLVSEWIEENFKNIELRNARKVKFTYDNEGDLSYADIYLLEDGTWIYGAKNICNYQMITDAKDDIVVNSFTLEQNYPNPFNPNTKISYAIPEHSQVSLKVFDVLGREVVTLVNQEQAVGNYEVEFTASDLPSGIYFYRIEAGQFVESKKMVLMK